MKSNKLSEVKEHIGELFTSEEILLSQDKLKLFLDATGNSNPIHFDEEGAKKSVLAEITSGEIVIPGFLTLSLCANEQVLYRVLVIDEPHEVVSLEIKGAKFLYPVSLNSKVIYEYKMKSVENRPIKSRPAARVDWDIIAYLVSGNERKPCMIATWTVAYVSIPH